MSGKLFTISARSNQSLSETDNFEGFQLQFLDEQALQRFINPSMFWSLGYSSSLCASQ